MRDAVAEMRKCFFLNNTGQSRDAAALAVVSCCVCRAIGAPQRLRVPACKK